MYLIDSNGNIVPDSKEAAFNVDMKMEMSKPEDKRQLPVFVAQIDGKTKYIMALYGKGLWGALWGYISVDEDGNTVYGTDFSHESETPGLGAEIAQKWFRESFSGKHLFQNGEFKSIAIVKRGKTVSDREYVDGISGGTITGRGVDHMLYDTLKTYSRFLSNLNKQ
jgi:Na+-transporting NADH:ubiquinone oxidoreductase subunit C